MQDRWVTADQIKPVAPATDGETWVTADQLHRVESAPAEAGPITRASEGFWRNFHPMDMVTNTVKSALDPFGTAIAEQDRYRDLARTGAQGSALEWLPFVGPQLAHAADQMREGNVAGGLGETAGTTAPMIIPIPKVGQIAEGTRALSRGAATTVENVGKIPLDKAMGLSGTAMGMGAGLAHYAANPEALPVGIAAGGGILAARTKLAQSLVGKLKEFGQFPEPPPVKGSAPRPPLGTLRGSGDVVSATGDAPPPPLGTLRGTAPEMSRTGNAPPPPLAPLASHTDGTPPPAPRTPLGAKRGSEFYNEAPPVDARPKSPPRPPLGPARGSDFYTGEGDTPSATSKLVEQLQASLKEQENSPFKHNSADMQKRFAPGTENRAIYDQARATGEMHEQAIDTANKASYRRSQMYRANAGNDVRVRNMGKDEY